MAQHPTTHTRVHFDRPFLFIVAALVLVGFFIFLSASLSVLAESPEVFYRILVSQVVLGLAGGLICAYVVFHIPPKVHKKYALIALLFGLAVTALVFIPGVGLYHGGAVRWIDLGFTSIQPSEILKIGMVMYVAAWFSFTKEKVKTFWQGLFPVTALLALSGGLLIAQPDTGTFLVLAITTVSIFYLAGANWRHIGVLFLLGLLGIGLLIALRPYVLDRFQTFLDVDRDPLGSSYQVKQSVIAVGSGGLWGEGYGQSIQKFDYLPEPTGDSIFAVAAEELGFVGAFFVLFLYFLFLQRGFVIANRSKDEYSRLLVSGLVILIVVQSCINIGATIRVFPLTGIPLVFISQGGTALMTALIAVGLILGVSRHNPASSP